MHRVPDGARVSGDGVKVFLPHDLCLRGLAFAERIEADNPHRAVAVRALVRIYMRDGDDMPFEDAANLLVAIGLLGVR